DYGVVEARALLDLEPGDLEPPSDRRRVVAAALLEPLAQRRERRRQQEDEARVRAPLAHLARAPHLDLEQELASAGQRPVERGPARAVAVAVVLRPLEECTLGDEPRELLARDEVVVDAVPLARPYRPRGMRHRELDPGIAVHHRAADGGLAGARRCRHDHREAGARDHGSFASLASPTSLSSAAKRAAIVSGLIADRITWSSSIRMIERVRRARGASTSFPRRVASSRRRFIGAGPDATIAITRDDITRFPYPMLSRIRLLNVLDLFAQPLDLGLQLHHPVCDRRVAALRPDRVRLAC